MKSRAYIYHQIVNVVRPSRHLSSDSKKISDLSGSYIKQFDRAYCFPVMIVGV